jgi:hypothetical protein
MLNSFVYLREIPVVTGMTEKGEATCHCEECERQGNPEKNANPCIFTPSALENLCSNKKIRWLNASSAEPFFL